MQSDSYVVFTYAALGCAHMSMCRKDAIYGVIAMLYFALASPGWVVAADALALWHRSAPVVVPERVVGIEGDG